MNIEKQRVQQAVRQALYAGLISAVAAPSAFAADADQNQNSNANQSSTATLGKIEVTGSRIKRTDVETAQPVTIISAAQIKATGLTAIGDVLQQMSQGGAALNTQFNNGGTGETFLNLRNLGVNRTLVLVNGKRWIADIGGTVDTNTIPVSIVDHVEVLQDGASAIYGSDAIAGVINIITIKDYNGAEANTFLGLYAGEGHHDGKQQEYDFTLGSSGDKGGVVMNVSYINQEAVWAGNRAISQEPVIGGGSASGSSSIPNGRFEILALDPTSPLAPKTCPPGVKNPKSHVCNMTVTTAGLPPSLSNFSQFVTADRFNFAPLNYLVTPSERTGLFVQGHYDLADNLTFTSEVLYNNRASQQVLAPSPLTFGSAGALFSNGQPIGIDATNPFNPFKVKLTANSSDACLSTATPSCDLLILAFRRPLEAGNRIFNENRTTFSYRGGLKGYFNMGGSEWDWDIGYMYGSNYDSNITNGLFNTERMAFALGPSATNPQTGAPGCLLNGSFLPGCVPFNFFSGPAGVTPAMLKYVQYEAHNVLSSTVRNYTANLTGDLFDLPAGPLSLATGYEYLEADGFSHPDALTVEGNTSGNTTQPADGAERTDAEYIEFSIPLVADAPFMKNVNLDIANRWSQFRWQGGEPGTATGVVHSTTNTSARAALRWQATDSLLMRGSWSQGFRIPSVSEFFLGASDAFPTLADPCAAFTGTPGTASANPSNCTGVSTQPNLQIKSSVGGNQSLTPEKSIAETAGFVYNPDFLPGFDFSADYYKIDVLNAVAAIPAQTILSGCYLNGSNGTPSPYCSLIKRTNGTAFGTTPIVNILDLNTNIGGLLTEGVDLQAGYKFPSTGIGDFKAMMNWTFVKEFVVTQPFGVSGALSSQEQSGTTGVTSGAVGGIPKQRANIDVGWNSGNWSASWHVEYVGAMIEDCEASFLNPATRCPLQGAFPFSSALLPGGAPVPENHIGATFYHDVAGTYHYDGWNTDFTFGIRNLFDKDPPIAMSAFANSFLPTFYRTPGRFFYARVGVKF